MWRSRGKASTSSNTSEGAKVIGAWLLVTPWHSVVMARCSTAPSMGTPSPVLLSRELALTETCVALPARRPASTTLVV